MKLLWSPNVSTGIPDSKVHGANMGPIWGRQDLTAARKVTLCSWCFLDGSVSKYASCTSQTWVGTAACWVLPQSGWFGHGWRPGPLAIAESGADMIDRSHKSHDAPVPYPTKHHFGTEIFTFLLQRGVLWNIGQVHCGNCDKQQLKIMSKQKSHHLQTTFSNTLSWMKIVVFRFNCH